ncbi:amidohydrolase family protein [Phenylobacterium sp.]|uniref:amidohydrolase family protein n=1 Tax=Phenylobacterium sp. TaxID=1871053 RepID=UPI002DEFE86F|nr:amidohydrolase family protein [Phenylobacterium sp.]
MNRPFGIRHLIEAAGAIAALALASQAHAQTVAIVNAHILTAGPKGEIANGTVLVRDGKIAAVGADVKAPAGAQVLDAKGQVVTPGFVAVNSALGAVEIGSLGNDLSVNDPQLGAAFDVSYALNPDSVLIPVARLGGLTTAVVTPRPISGRGGEDDEEDASSFTAGGPGSGDKTHGLFAGQAAVVHLGVGGGAPLRIKVAMVSPFGNSGAKLAGGARGAEFVALKTALQDVRDFMKNRAAYERAGYRDLALSKVDLEALIPVVEGRMPLLVEVAKASDIRAVLRLAREEHVKLILNGAEEGWKVASEIAAAGVPVIMNPISDRPVDMESVGSTLENAARLNAAGVIIAIEGQGGANRAHEARFNAGNAVAHGLPFPAALAALTLNPARMFGVADRIGSLEPGKDADLVIWSGDPFEPLSRPQLILIEGKPQPLTSRQIELRDRYRDLARPYPPEYTHN